MDPQASPTKNSSLPLFLLIGFIILVIIASVYFAKQSGLLPASLNQKQTKQQKTKSNCSDLYQPVCGQDNITYLNDCEAKAAGAKIKQQGACKK